MLSGLRVDPASRSCCAFLHARVCGDGSLFSGDWSGFFKVFFFILVIGLLAYITLRLMGNAVFLSNKRVDDKDLEYSIDKIEEDIHQSDLEGFARHALDKQDYKLAIRLYFLQILKNLR